jgi:hypothetical protein
MKKERSSKFFNDIGIVEINIINELKKQYKNLCIKFNNEV